MPAIQNPTSSTEEYAQAVARLGAVHRLAMGRQQRPELARAEANARVALAAAILAMDEVDERIAAGEKLHSLQEQANVEVASGAYTLALANLLRGED